MEDRKSNRHHKQRGLISLDRGSPQELGEFLIRSVGSRKNPSRDNAHTFDKNHNCPLHSVPKGFIQISSLQN